MAIQPIDLQTLFTQVDKVGKAQTALKDGLVLQQAIQGAQMERKTEERIQSVNETQNTGEGAEKITDRGGRGQASAEGGGKRQEEDEQAPQGEEPRIIRDPTLGRNIDISL